MEKIQRVLIIGAGTMGLQIGFQCAAHGCDVVVHDASTEAMAKGPERVKAYAREIEAARAWEPARLSAGLERMSFVADLAEAARDVDLVSESVPEDPKLKGEVFARLNRLCPAHTIFATNTSTLVPSQFAKATGRPSQLLAFHFHTPVWASNVVDVMGHAGTSPEIVEAMRAFGERIGQVPIVLAKESGGYVFNAMLSALNREALTLAANGVATPEDVDRAWMGVMKTGIGPFGIMDLIGLDTVHTITDYWARRLVVDRQLHKNAAFLKPFIEEGRLGRKTGRGIYSYPGPAFEKKGFASGHTATDI